MTTQARRKIAVAVGILFVVQMVTAMVGTSRFRHSPTVRLERRRLPASS